MCVRDRRATNQGKRTVNFGAESPLSEPDDESTAYG